MCKHFLSGINRSNEGESKGGFFLLCCPTRSNHNWPLYGLIMLLCTLISTPPSIGLSVLCPVISIPSSIVFSELSVHIYQTTFCYVQEDHTFGGGNMLNTNFCRTFFLLQECMAHHLANSSYCLWMMWTCPWRRSMGLSLPSSFSGNYTITGRGITRMLPLSNWLTCR